MVDECPIVLDDDTDVDRQAYEDQFRQWLTVMRYPIPKFFNSPHRPDWLALRRLRFHMAKAVADRRWDYYRRIDRDSPTPTLILQEVIVKIRKGESSHDIDPKSFLGPVSADQLSGNAYKRSRGPRSPPRGGPPAPTYYGSSGSHTTCDRVTRHLA